MSKLFKSLLFKLSLIEKQIDREHSRPAKDWLKLIRLKKLRLKIKDKLTMIAAVNIGKPRRRVQVPITIK